MHVLDTMEDQCEWGLRPSTQLKITAPRVEIVRLNLARRRDLVDLVEPFLDKWRIVLAYL